MKLNIIIIPFHITAIVDDIAENGFLPVTYLHTHLVRVRFISLF